MKISIFSLIISVTVAILSLLQFERYQSLEKMTESHIQTLSDTLNTQMQNLQQDVSKIAKTEQQLIQHQPAVLSTLAEVRHLTTMAAVQLQATGDIDTSVKLLKLAEAKLEHDTNDKIIQLRQTLTDERTTLQAIHQTDLTELWRKIALLINTVPELPTKGIRNEKQPTPIETSTETHLTQSESNWKQSLINSWQEIKSLVKIRHHSKPIEPILSEQDAQLIKQNMMLLLQQLQLAVLQKNQTLYNNILEETKKSLDSHFETSNLKVIEMQKTLNYLETLSLKPTLPTLQLSLDQLQSLKD